MNAEKFLANFWYAANAPRGVGRLRDLIYHFAFAGELVKHSRDNAGDLAEALALAESPTGRIRRPTVEPSTGYYPIPSHWRWVNIGVVGHDWGQMKPDDDFTYIDVSTIDNSRGVVADGAAIVSADKAPSRARKIVKKGTVIYSTVRPYLLNIAVIERDFDPAPIASTAFAILHPYDGVQAKYVYYFLRSPAFVAYVEGVQSGIAYPAISDQKFFAASFPLAPTKEQKRIVAKVDELMALCDHLEAQQHEREQSFPVLSRTCHARFAEAPTPVNLNRIFDEPGTVSPADLRKTILTLAVRGKLLPQDPGDEAVERSLAKNDTERRKTARSDRRADSENQTLLSADDRWEIADTWSWRGLADLVLFVDYRGKTPTKLSSGVRLLTAKNVRKGAINLSPEEFLSEADYESWMTRGFPRPVDVLFTTEAPMGNAAVVQLTERFALAQRVICFQSYGAIDPSFLVMQILSDGFQFILDKNGTGVTAKGIKASKLKRLPIAVPPLTEQIRIVAKVNQLTALADHLEEQQHEKDKLADGFAKACVVLFTGTVNLEKKKKMKAPKTELVSVLEIGKMRKPNAEAPLATLLRKHKGELPAKALWQHSGLAIEAFYQQLKTEIAQGSIAPPKEAEMKVLEEV